MIISQRTSVTGESSRFREFLLMTSDGPGLLICKYLPSRSALAAVWLNEEWYSERLREKTGSVVEGSGVCHESFLTPPIVYWSY